jgi:PAS domain S-box-containing protein
VELSASDLRSPAYDLLFRRSVRPAYVFDRRSFVFLDVNDAALALYGYERDAFLDMTVLDIRPPEDVPPLLRAIRDGTVPDIPWRHQRSDGTVLYVDIAYQHVLWSGHDAVFVTVLDVTAREAAQHELAMSEERFRLIFDASPIGIASVGTTFRFLDANPAYCRMLGYSREELVGMTVLDVTHVEDREADAELAGRLMRGEIASYTFEKRYVRADGDSVWVALTVFAARDDDGRARYLIGLAEDVTDRKGREDEVRREALDAIGRLARLSERECETLDLARTMTAREIAERFTISTRTVESHLATAYRKLGANTREAAIGEFDRLRAAAAPLPSGIGARRPTDDRVRTEVP